MNQITKGTLSAGSIKVGGENYFAIPVINKSGTSIAAGKLVYISGYDATTKMPKITLSDNSANNKLAQFITIVAIANNAIGLVYEKYTILGQNTNSASAVGDPVYLSTAGAWTLTAPTTANTIVQIVGYVTVKSATVGQILFLVQPQNIPKIGMSSIQAGALKVTLANGTASATDVAVTGMTATDELIFVGSFTTAAAIASLADRTSEYACGAVKLTKAAGTNETSNQLIIIWIDRS
jgi:hypothetical protein